jgi:hypothetical protein
MLKRYWRKHRDVIRWVAIAAACFLGVLISYGAGILIGQNLGHYDAEASGYSAQYPGETDKRVRECLAHVPIGRAQECAQEAIEAGRESQRSEQDLSAQRQMAKWALWLLIFTVVQSLLGFGGFLILILTIRQGREAIAISRKVAEADLRPYLFVDRLELVDVSDASTFDPDTRSKVYGYYSAKVVIYLKNFGKVPARNIHIAIKQMYGKLYYGEFFRPSLVKLPIGVRAPGHQRRVFGYLIVSPDDRRDFDVGFISYILRMRYSFEDGDGNRFNERAEYSLSGDDLETFYLLGKIDVASARKRQRTEQLPFDKENEGEN